MAHQRPAPDATAHAVTARHGRQELFRHVGPTGQARLAAGRVLVLGLGATGSNIAASLARSGVGHLTLVDRDYPERSNLQRNALLVDADVDALTPKAVAAAAHLTAIDPALELRAEVADLHPGNALALCAGHDVLVDGTDNFAARFLLNDVALHLGLPWVYCGAVGAHGATMAIPAGGRPCLRCLFPEAPPIGRHDTCDTAGVLQPAVAAVAAVAALSVLKLLLGAEIPREILYLDLWERSWQPFAVAPNPACASCAHRTFPALQAGGSGELLTTSLCGRESVHLRPPETRLDLPTLAERLSPAVPLVLANEHLLRFAVGPHEVTLFADGRAIVTGTQDEALARSIYARYVGH